MATSNPYKWHYHSAKKNETAAAICAALDNNCGLLVVVCKPDCSVCAKICGKDYMDLDGKFAAYLKAHKIVGLKIEDSQSHEMAIASGINSYYNYDHTKTDKNVPFLLLVKPKESSRKCKSFQTLKKNTDIDLFFGGFGSKTASGQTYPKVAAWLDLMLDPKLAYWDKRDNYATVYGEGSAQHSASAPAKTSYRVTADITCTMRKAFSAMSEAEARKLAEKELKAWTLTMPDGWEGDDGEAAITVEED